jgi:hypothetical protein
MGRAKVGDHAAMIAACPETQTPNAEAWGLLIGQKNASQ